MTIIPINNIVPNPQQPRREIDPDELQVLTDSIRQHGLINPIAVEVNPYGGYILIDGERRWRAAKAAGLDEIEASIRPSSNGNGDRDRLVLALVANLQRSDMTPIDEAESFQRMRTMGFTVDEISQIAGMHKSNIRVRLAMLDFDPKIQDLFAARKLPLHWNTIYALRSIPDDKRIRIATGLASRNATIATIKSVCSRIANAILTDNPLDKSAPPAMQLAMRTKSGKSWDIFSQTPGLPALESVQKAAHDSCKKCALYDMASPSNCKDCPLVDFLKLLGEGK